MTLNRSGFKRKTFERAPRPALAPVIGCRGVYARASDAVVTLPKDARDMAPGDEKRLWDHVRSLPCARCWREGMTEVSHSNQIIDGKGKALKAFPWRVAALCHECHAMLDQGSQHKKAARREEWNSAHRWTLGQLFERGMVRPV